MAKKNITHPVHLGQKAIPSLNALLKKNKYTSYFILCDSNTLNNCLSYFISVCPVLSQAEIIELEPGEESKDISVVAHIWQTLTDFGADKNSVLINLGGGVVSDIGGFAASTYKRGIDFINVPTSLLAMADASVGGKTGINFSGIKNSIGTITQPKAVFIDPAFLQTLPQNHLVNGFAEIFKITLISDRISFGKLCGINVTPQLNWTSIVKKAVELKSKIVEKDPNEKGRRKILNFGHSIGHALESLFLEKEIPVLHGEAIAMGMVIESYISFLKKRISKVQMSQIQASLHINFQFPVLNPSDFDRLMHFIKQDKKNKNSVFLFALLKGFGNCDIDVKVSAAEIKKAVSYYNSNIASGAA